MPDNVSKNIVDDLSIVLCGEAGQGIQTVEMLLTRVVKIAGYNVFATKEYMSRVRGGSNSTEIRVTSERRHAYVEKIDILIPLDKDAIPHLGGRVTDDTVIIGDREKLGTGRAVTDVPFTKIAGEIGGAIYANTVATGLILGLLDTGTDLLDDYLERFFKKKSRDVIDHNKTAGKRGYDIGRSLTGPGKIDIRIQRHPGIKDESIINGAEAIALGAVGGGCNFMTAYPMTPSTGILTYLSQHAADFDMIAEQAEDEIAAINMVLGAWYAGARGMVATAGGGFALMVEGLSLAGMIESPAVISVGQRPAPATGLPTRTEQGDLEHVLYAGHGEFPRVVLAPGNIEEAFFLSAKAFTIADKFQVPVIILSDQYLADSYYNLPAPDTGGLEPERYFVKTDREYRRYRITGNGISPRGIPGYGEGLVAVDSDEHDEEGRITESMEVRKSMVDKRLRKRELLQQEALPPALIGNREYETLVICWGSTREVVQEAIERSGRTDTAVLHFSQVYPLHSSAAEYLRKAKHTVIVENNATAQFARLLQLHTGMAVREKILKYDGMPFSVEQLTARFKSIGQREPQTVGGAL